LTLEDGDNTLSQNIGKNYHYTLRNNPEEGSSHLLNGRNLKSQNEHLVEQKQTKCTK